MTNSISVLCELAATLAGCSAEPISAGSPSMTESDASVDDNSYGSYSSILPAVGPPETPGPGCLPANSTVGDRGVDAIIGTGIRRGFPTEAGVTDVLTSVPVPVMVVV